MAPNPKESQLLELHLGNRKRVFALPPAGLAWDIVLLRRLNLRRWFSYLSRHLRDQGLSGRVEPAENETT